MKERSPDPLYRRLARRFLSPEARLLVRVLQRRVEDRRRGVRFASRRGSRLAFPHAVSRYERRLIDYPGQEAVSRAKRLNQSILACYLSGIVIEPGETFSIWRLAPRPTARGGYGEAAALRGNELLMEVGGAICLLSTVLYNVALLGGMRIIERHCHSLDSYGDARYFELGRDAAIEYGYRDLRFRNPHEFPLLLCIEQRDDAIEAGLYAAEPAAFEAQIFVSEPDLRELEGGEMAMRMRAFRSLHFANGETASDRLPDTLHRLPRPVDTPLLLDGEGARPLR
jgi:vancomycin resistance protein VanW